jgi:hypothetical protein
MASGFSASAISEATPGCAGVAKEQSMRFAGALLGTVLFAVPAAAQPFIVPLQQKHQSEAPPPAASPAPVAPPQSGMQTDGPSQADASGSAQLGNAQSGNAQSGNAQSGDATNSTQADGAQSDASHASGH